MSEFDLFKRYNQRMRLVYLLTVILSVLVITLTNSAGIYGFLPSIFLFGGMFWARGFDRSVYKHIKLRRAERFKTDAQYKTKAMWLGIPGLLGLLVGVYLIFTIQNPVVLPAFVAIYGVYALILMFVFPTEKIANPAEIFD